MGKCQLYAKGQKVYKCQLYAKGQKVYPITKGENILMDDGTSLSSQLDKKANLNDVAKISSGTPLFANSTDEMTDITKNYVNTTDGYLYVYNNGSFVSSGVKYQEKGLSDFEVKERYLSLTTLTNNLFDIDKIEKGKAGSINQSNKFIISNNATWSLSNFFEAEQNIEYWFKVYETGNTLPYRAIVYCFDSNNTPLGIATTPNGVEGSFSSKGCKVFVTLPNTSKIRLQYYSILDSYSQISFVKSTDYKTYYEPKFKFPYLTEKDFNSTTDEINSKIDNNYNYLNEKLNSINQGGITVTYGDSQYEWFNTNANKKESDKIRRMVNTCASHKMLNNNEINLFQSGTDKFNHDATLCLHYDSTKLYAVYVANEVDTGDSSYNQNAYIRLQVIQGNVSGTIGSILKTIKVCGYGSVIEGKTVISGSGVPNAYMVGDILHIIWSNRLSDNKYYECHATYNCLTDTLSSLETCTINNEPFMCENLASNFEMSTNGQISMNAKIAELNGWYYACACSDWQWKNGAIVKTQNFKEWEFVTVPQFDGFDSNATYEGAMGQLGGELYLALRQVADPLRDVTPLILAKLDSECNVIDYVLVPSISSRPDFFNRGTTELYLAFATNDRTNTVLLNISPKLRDSIPLQDITTGGNYVQICPRTATMQFVIRTGGTTGVRISSMNGLAKDENSCMSLLIDALGV